METLDAEAPPEVSPPCQADAGAALGEPEPQTPTSIDPFTEPGWKRWMFCIIAIVYSVGVVFFIFSFSAPAPGRAGIDENAYLVGGKMLAEHGTTGFRPSDDYQFVGAMWLRTSGGWYYPKYPFGTSLLDAAMILIHHREWAFLVSPACTALAVLGMFFLARPIVGSFYAMLAMILLSMGPTTLWLSVIPNSHAPALCCVVWGMCFLMNWWRTGRWWIGAAAGLLLGYAVTVRYTEALLLFPFYALDVVRTDQFIGPKAHAFFRVLAFLPVGPLGIAVLSRVNWKSWRSYFVTAIPALAWCVPVAALVSFNRFTVGHFSGYDSTNESVGFSIEYLIEKWEFAVNQLDLFGLFVIAPLAVAGLVLMYRGAWRTALVLTAWFVPGTFLYMAYYWGNGVPGVWFMRFLLTLLPPMIIAAMYFLRSIEPLNRRAVLSPIVAGLLVACASAIGLRGSIDELARQHRGNMNLQYSAREIMSHMAKPSKAGRPMILADKGMFPQLLQYMQFMVDADWYASDIFAIRSGGGFGLAGVLGQDKKDASAPVTLQQARIDYIDSIRRGKQDAEFIADAHRLMQQALDSGRKIYVVLEPIDAPGFRTRFISKEYQMIEVSHWSEPCRVSFPDWEKQSDLSPRVLPDTEFIPWHPVRRVMFEIRRAGS